MFGSFFYHTISQAPKRRPYRFFTSFFAVFRRNYCYFILFMIKYIKSDHKRRTK